MCDCKVCQYSREFEAELALLPEANRPFFEKLFENYSNKCSDLNHAEAILEGSWPESDEIIAGARKRAAERFAAHAAARAAVASECLPVVVQVAEVTATDAVVE